jgi:transposase-like protein
MTKIVMSKQAMREETDRLVKAAMDKKGITIKQADSRIDVKCGKCGAPNRVKVPKAQARVEFTCKECGYKQRAL